jgi:restriction system protein
MLCFGLCWMKTGENPIVRHRPAITLAPRPGFWAIFASLKAAMKLKMSDKSMFAHLLRSPWWVSLGLVLAVALAARALLPEAYVAVGVMGGFPFLVIAVITAWRQFKAPNPAHLALALQQAAAMNWRDFSAAVEQAFVRQGFVVVPQHGAADFRLEKAGRTTLVSCKRWKAANQGVDALRELVTTKNAQEADFCSFISLAAVTASAEKYAKENQVQLISNSALAQLLYR